MCWRNVTGLAQPSAGRQFTSCRYTSSYTSSCAGVIDSVGSQRGICKQAHVTCLQAALSSHDPTHQYPVTDHLVIHSLAMCSNGLQRGRRIAPGPGSRQRGRSRWTLQWHILRACGSQAVGWLQGTSDITPRNALQRRGVETRRVETPTPDMWSSIAAQSARSNSFAR